MKKKNHILLSLSVLALLALSACSGMTGQALNEALNAADFAADSAQGLDETEWQDDEALASASEGFSDTGVIPEGEGFSDAEVSVDDVSFSDESATGSVNKASSDTSSDLESLDSDYDVGDTLTATGPTSIPVGPAKENCDEDLEGEIQVISRVAGDADIKRPGSGKMVFWESRGRHDFAFAAEHMSDRELDDADVQECVYDPESDAFVWETAVWDEFPELDLFEAETPKRKAKSFGDFSIRSR
ncbi:MAG: hypothetical protein H7A33_04295 [Deltaproteobacteria bacterium]|nr:hypothetical protein [Deltaproteobacteria bacterium]